MADEVTVVIPTFNRAQLLKQTIPSYIQEGVSSLVIVDDASTDGTHEVVSQLSVQYPDKIIYLRNQYNRKQHYSKNLGKALASTKWVYFGDDDSVIVEGSIRHLVDVAKSQNANIVGAAAIYCKNGESVADVVSRFRSSTVVATGSELVDLERLKFCFFRRTIAPVEVPVTQAAFLISRDFYRLHDFDLRYTSNCYREETDFLLGCQIAGAKILFSSDAIQVNLPPNIAIGGARSGGKIRYEWYALLNTFRFLRKHSGYYENKFGRLAWIKAILMYMKERLVAAFRKVLP